MTYIHALRRVRTHMGCSLKSAQTAGTATATACTALSAFRAHDARISRDQFLGGWGVGVWFGLVAIIWVVHLLGFKKDSTIGRPRAPPTPLIDRSTHRGARPHIQIAHTRNMSSRSMAVLMATSHGSMLRSSNIRGDAGGGGGGAGAIMPSFCEAQRCWLVIEPFCPLPVLV